MNHTMIAIIIVASTLVIVGTGVAPLMQREAYASLKHPLKSQILSQQFLCYRSPGCHGINLAEQVSGKGNSVTGWGDQSSNTQQNQTQLQPSG
jgi:hypothetical protein